MKIIEIKSQEELNAFIPGEKFTELRIVCPKLIIVRKKWENSSVVAWENSSVVAWENSSVVARENSSVVARGNSSVEARENSSVVALGNSFVRSFGQTVKVKAKNNSVVIFQDCDGTLEEKDDTATILRQKTWIHTKEDFLGIYKDRGPNGGVILYKSVEPETKCDFFTGKIKYDGLVECPDWDADWQDACGKGLHLSPTPMLAKSYNQGFVLKCEVLPEDFVVYGKDITKVRCRRVRVLEDSV
jgi:co-chaperonin GroES (HSP10)